MKITIEEIKQDLKDVKYYFAHEALFQKALKDDAVKILIMKVYRYKEIMRGAPFDLMIIFEGLYMYKQTQKSLAEYLEISERTVRRKREQIYLYLQKRLRFYPNPDKK